ncbi:hypothetical protein ACLOJK_031048 [Asimina triloba]
MVGKGLGRNSTLPYVMASQLSSNFYEKSCPSVLQIVRQQMKTALKADIAAINDLFGGCDASIHLDGPSGNKFAAANMNSARERDGLVANKPAVEWCPVPTFWPLLPGMRFSL